MPDSTPSVPPPTGLRRPGPAVAALVAVVFVWACWTTLQNLAEVWATNPQYSHGFLVPVFSAFLLWHRRALFAPAPGGGWGWWLVVGAGCGLKLVGAYYILVWPEQVSVVVLVAGLVGVFGGRPAMRWAWPGLAFLLFMVPPPARVERLLSGPMQRVATVASANVLQTLGFFAQADGTIIILSETDLGVVEACSGLRMLVTFAAMSMAIALVLPRPAWQRAALVAGSVPIAVVCNVGRIVVTGIMHETVGKKWADLVFHDLAGWLMMPAGLALLWAELWYLGRVVRTEAETRVVKVANPAIVGNRFLAGTVQPPNPSGAAVARGS
ncbi:MAG: eight transrane protein EpsH, putative exosortase [Gemmataceae bacterium]|nr:eight transrane protein EpsH, putative exosortase [Gemmataceae bacterium]